MDPEIRRYSDVPEDFTQALGNMSQILGLESISDIDNSVQILEAISALCPLSGYIAHNINQHEGDIESLQKAQELLSEFDLYLKKLEQLAQSRIIELVPEFSMEDFSQIMWAIKLDGIVKGLDESVRAKTIKLQLILEEIKMIYLPVRLPGRMKIVNEAIASLKALNDKVAQSREPLSGLELSV